jgi:rod shape-determining protein MreD
MNNIIVKNIIRFILLVLLQVFIFNKIYLGGFINPYIYLLFIILLPFETPWWLLLLSSFGIGLSVDIFTGSMGMHAATATLIAYLRPSIIRIILPKLDSTLTVYPGIGFMGFPTFTLYTFILVFIHHFAFFVLEALSFSDFPYTLLRITLSTLVSAITIIILELIFRKK